MKKATNTQSTEKNQKTNLQDEIAENSLIINNFTADYSAKNENPNPQKKQNINENNLVNFSDLKPIISSYLSESEVELVKKACECSKQAHKGQKRNSGEDYYHHPVAVALILANMRADCVSIASALLHDVIEDTKVTLTKLQQDFGNEIAEIVDGVSKLNQFKFSTIQDSHAENFLKMILAMCKDVRVMLVKVADRLHNMRTLDSMPADKQRKKSQETLEIYAPISMRLGLSQIQYELEDLGLKYLYPDRYRVLNDKILEITGGRKNFVQDVETAIKEHLFNNKIECRVFGRKKNLYSLYRKMRYKRVNFDQIEDTYAFRVIVKDAPTCYQVLGLIHSFYTPIPKTVEDYIAMPKLNGYQSIHTEVIAPFGVRIEVQLRTEEMNQIAEYGVAAHWRYKAKGGSDYDQNARKWLARVIETKEASEDPLDFMEKMKMDLQPHEVYIITPKGAIFRMPYDSIGVDFAFAIHTDVGLKANSMIVNGNLCEITDQLSSGQRIEIVTSDKECVNKNWLFQVKTPKAKNAIAEYFKKAEKIKFDELKGLGKNLLNQSLNKTGNKKFDDLDESKVKGVLKSLNLKNTDELFIAIAQRKLTVKDVSKSLLGLNVLSLMMNKLKPKKKQTQLHTYLVSAKSEPLAHFARCCGAIPGDDIVAEIKPAGYVVHRSQCKLILKKLSKLPDQCMIMKWDDNATDYTYRTSIGITTKNVPEAFTKITSLIGESKADIENIRHTSHDYKTKYINCTVWAHSASELEEIIKAVSSYLFVKSVSRTNH